MKYFLCAFEKLRLCDSRVTQKQDIDITSNSVSSFNNLFNSSEHSQGKCSFYIFMSIDRRRNRVIDELIDVFLFWKLKKPCFLLCTFWFTSTIEKFADTVGFIRNLPHDLVVAFKATLQEIVDADLILHVIDATDANMQGNINQVQGVLTEIGAENGLQLRIFNKIDGANNFD